MVEGAPQYISDTPKMEDHMVATVKMHTISVMLRPQGVQIKLVTLSSLYKSIHSTNIGDLKFLALAILLGENTAS